jgi:serine phosphatase RsbU (regulator of sigma subunit)
MPLGLMPGMSYEQNEMSLQVGDCIFFYCDGLVEAHNAHREMFGFPRLRELVDEYVSGDGSLVGRLLNELSGFAGAESEHGDITLVVLLPAPRTRSRSKAALMRARWVKAYGKLPRASPLGPISSS